MNEYTRKDFDRDNPAAKDMKSNIAKHKASRNFDKQIAAVKANSSKAPRADDGIASALMNTRKALGGRTVWEGLHGNRPTPSYWNKKRSKGDYVPLRDIPVNTPGYDRP